MEILLTALLKPFVLLVFLIVVVYPINKFLYWAIPESRVKTALYDRGLRDRKPWVFVVGAILSYVFIAAMYWLVNG